MKNVDGRLVTLPIAGIQPGNLNEQAGISFSWPVIGKEENHSNVTMSLRMLIAAVVITVKGMH